MYNNMGLLVKHDLFIRIESPAVKFSTSVSEVWPCNTNQLAPKNKLQSALGEKYNKRKKVIWKWGQQQQQKTMMKYPHKLADESIKHLTNYILRYFES